MTARRDARRGEWPGFAGPEGTGRSPPDRSMTRRSAGLGRRRGRAQRALGLVAIEQLAPVRGLPPVLEHAAIAQRPAVVVVVGLGAEHEQVDQRGPEEQVLEP